MENARKATWVLQRTEKGYYLPAHNDDCSERKIAFVYYLTPSDWDWRNDGGELEIGNKDGGTSFRFNPTFNNLITWDMVKEQSPLHWINTVKAENDRPRIALVGFWT
jgi:Rps23 Pro-64 3,4-dihydroxylase Tpa1-like proline 4-hydroxylase